MRELHEAHVASLRDAYAAVLARHGFDGVLIHSGSLVRKTRFDDQDWPLRTTPHFQHWLPLAEPDCHLLVMPGARPKLFRPETTSFWETRPEPPAAWLLEPFDVVRGDVEPPAGKRVAFVGEEVRPECRRSSPPRSTLSDDQDALRDRVSRPGERARGARSTKPLRKGVRRGRDERASSSPDVPRGDPAGRSRDALQEHRRLRAQRGDAPPRHATARNASGAPSLLVDAGATFYRYCSDITRTWVRGGTASADAFAGLVGGVEAMQQRLCAAIRSGDKYEALHDLSHRLTSEILLGLGIVRDLSAEAVDRQGISRAFYPHGLGHSLGLQTHDVGCAVMKPRADNPFLRNTSVIAPRQVFTIEPGVYFIESLLAKLRAGPFAANVDWRLVESMAPLGGVRIEDDVLVGDDGIRNFTREVLPRGGGAP